VVVPVSVSSEKIHGYHYEVWVDFAGGNYLLLLFFQDTNRVLNQAVLAD
jgi:hypothetical protein